MTMTYSILNPTNVFHRALKAVFDESQPNKSDVVELTPIDDYRMKFAVDAQNDPNCFEIHSSGTMYLDHLKNAVLIDIEHSVGEPCIAVYDIDTKYTYYFHK